MIRPSTDRCSTPSQIHRANVVGIDTGLTLLAPTSGVCRTGADGFLLGHTYLDKLSRVHHLRPPKRIDCLAIDAPVLPGGELHYARRLVESLFQSGAFRTRCKPAATHVRGSGQALRRAGCETALQFHHETTGPDFVPYPRVLAGQNVIEAFPNAFLAALLPANVIDAAAAPRGEKTDTFFVLCQQSKAFTHLQRHLTWDDPAFWASFAVTAHHDERAALICAATAVCAQQNAYVAVGDEAGGYFFLPPWRCWQPWAREALREQGRRRDRDQVMVWRDGQRVKVQELERWDDED